MNILLIYSEEEMRETGYQAFIHWTSGAQCTVAQSSGGPHLDLKAQARGIKEWVKAVVRSLSPGLRAWQPGTGEGGEEHTGGDTWHVWRCFKDFS